MPPSVVVCSLLVRGRGRIRLTDAMPFDRTLEFHQIVASRRTQPAATARPPVSRTEFASAASAIGGDIRRAQTKLSKLTQLAQSRSLFEDPTAEINELTHIIKQDITALNGKLTGLQSHAKSVATSGAGKQRTAHSSSVVDSLKERLLEATKEFQDVLHTRSHNMQLMQKRREEFSAPAVSSGGGNPSGSSGMGAGSNLGAASGAVAASGRTIGQPPTTPELGGGGAGFGEQGASLGVPRKRFAAPAPIFELCAPPPCGDGGASSSSGGSGSGGSGSGGALYKKSDDYPGAGGMAAAWASPAAKPAGMSSGAGGAVVIDMSSIGSAQQQQQEFLPMSGTYLDSRAQARLLRRLSLALAPQSLSCRAAKPCAWLGIGRPSTRPSTLAPVR